MNLNPLDLRGPEFLALYTGLLAATATGVAVARRALEAPPRPVESLAEDPYRIAMLRGGNHELVLVSVVSLVERDLAHVIENKLFLKRGNATDLVRRPLDRAIVSKLHLHTSSDTPALALGRTVDGLLEDSIISSECDAVRAQLASEGYLPDERCLRNRRVLAWGATAALWAFALAKVMTALSRGHSNVGFLILLGIATPFVMLFMIRGPRTNAGNNALSKVQDWYSKLRAERSSFKMGETSSELTFLAAVYGYQMLPLQAITLLPPPLPPKRQSDTWISTLGSDLGSGDTGSSGASSCSSGSSSCSGGSGCGGCGGGGD